MVTSHVDPYFILWDGVVVQCQLAVLVVLVQQLCHQLALLVHWSSSCVTSLVTSSIHLTAVGFSTSDLSSSARMRSPVSVTSPNITLFWSCCPFSSVRFTPILFFFNQKIWALCCRYLKPSWVQRAELCLLDTDGCSQFAALTVSVSVLWQSLFLSQIPAAWSSHLC